MAITTLARTKSLMGIAPADTSKDTAIELLIPEVEELLKAETNQTFVDINGIAKYPGGAELTAIRMIGYLLDSPDTQSDSLDGASTTRTSTASGWSTNIQKLINNLKRIKKR